ncbi:DnaJ-domain-containing protein [Neolentinus lepideus HHB14362 ss-1]|uniref:DnaJ-domain-containing protein n=1 Tax=Neolentinus lepideus HHB14362 ss-1 TaxID=1314782 RepID=A0A165VHI5_9AGAM|nr:DnaJ-domain-containing protein [Neolentinus lepideus HHB14362 ss-1]
MGADYYKLLGLSKDASDDDIKRAYKKMALKWHPDRNAGSEDASKKFQQISEAFEVLSDKNKRAVYDQFGEEGLKGGGPQPSGGAGAGGFPGGFSGFPGGGGTTFTFTSGPGGFGGGRGGFSPTDPNKIFEQFFGGLGGGGFGGVRSMNGMFGGAGDEDDDMSGFGGFSGMPGGMGGFGRRTSARPSPSSRPASSGPTQSSEITRPLKISLEDLYNGASKHVKVGRRLLSGGTEDKVLEIQVMPGWKSGTKVRFARAGNEQPDGEAQDLVFVVEEKPHDRFTRNNDDLETTVKIPLVDALTGTGGTKTVEALDGRKIQVPVPGTIVKPNSVTKVPNEGMPIRKQGGKKKGDLLVKWDVVFPDRLTTAQKEGVRKVLG